MRLLLVVWTLNLKAKYTGTSLSAVMNKSALINHTKTCALFLLFLCHSYIYRCSLMFHDFILVHINVFNLANLCSGSWCHPLNKPILPLWNQSQSQSLPACQLNGTILNYISDVYRNSEMEGGKPWHLICITQRFCPCLVSIATEIFHYEQTPLSNISVIRNVDLLFSLSFQGGLRGNIDWHLCSKMFWFFFFFSKWKRGCSQLILPCLQLNYTSRVSSNFSWTESGNIKMLSSTQDSAVGHKLPPATFTFNHTNCILYALGVGMSTKDPDHLR